MTDKLSWLLLALQIYIITSSAIWTANHIGWGFTIIVLVGTFILAYFEIGAENGET